MMSIARVASAVTITAQEAAIQQVHTEEIAQQTAMQASALDTVRSNILENYHYVLNKDIPPEYAMTVTAKAALLELPPYMLKQRLDTYIAPLMQEEEDLHKGLITVRQHQESLMYRAFSTVLQRRRLEIEELDVPTLGINATEQTVLATMDKYLYENFPIETNFIVGQMVKAAESRTNRIKTLMGSEALQKQLIQLYMPSQMTHPFTLNIMALRMSALTMPFLLGKSMTIYYMGAMQAEGLKLNEATMPALNRNIITKATASGKTPNESVPSKFAVGFTKDFTGDEKVGVPKDHNKNETLWLMLRYAFAMPYWLRRMIAIQTGMPENSKYASYFGIGGLPSRYSTWRYKFWQYPEARYLKFSVNQDVMNLIMKYQSKRGAFYARYGAYYTKTRV